MQLIFRILIILLVTQSTLFSIGTQFLSIPISTSELILGVNPMIVVSAERPILSASYGNWLGDIKTSSFGYDQKLLGGTTGFKLRYVALNDLELRLDRPTSEPLSVFTASSFAIDGKYLRNTKLGMFKSNIRYISIQLFDESSQGFALDFNINRSLTDKFKVGLSILNIGKMSKLYEEIPQLPIRTIIGSSFATNFKKINNSTFATLEKSSIVDGIIIRFGNVTSWDKIQMLFGAQYSQDTISVSSGINLRLGIYQIGYGIQIGSQALGIPQMLDISVYLP